MRILAIHFGHDASITLFNDGVVEVFFDKERVNRVRHAIGIDAKDVAEVLSRAGVSVDAVDYCAVTSTQDVEFLFVDPETLRFRIDPLAAGAVPSPLLAQIPTTVKPEGPQCIRRILRGDAAGSHYARLLAQYLPGLPETWEIHDSVEKFLWCPEWDSAAGLGAIARTDYGALANQRNATSFHLPITMHVLGRKLPGALFSHHFAHAAYAYYTSVFDRAAVVTHDGMCASGYYDSGLFFYGEGPTLYPVAPHWLNAGAFYDFIGTTLGFDIHGAAGKLMGLAAYGSSRYVLAEDIGNWNDLRGPLSLTTDGHEQYYAEWLNRVLSQTVRAGGDTSAFGKKEYILSPVNVDIAATAQGIFEETMVAAVSALLSSLSVSGNPVRSLCLSGGAALNCPANSLIWRRHRQRLDGIHIPPACNDAGLSLGAAMALYHNVFEQERRPVVATTPTHLAFLGTKCATDAEAFLKAASAEFEVVHHDRPELVAAELLAANGVVGWYQGGSEVGPRALGHRSILAHPCFEANWARVNRIKRREHWRPFAPMVLEEHAAEWFSGLPLPSRYMLFNARVRSPLLAAVTHTDQTARLQTVGPSDGRVYRLLEEFWHRTQIPVLLNTSLNGPSEPLVETPDDALNFFRGSELDCLVLESWIVKKRPTGR